MYCIFSDGPNEVRILRRKSVYSPGDVLTCDAKSSPEPHFQWKNLETGEVLEGRELFIRGSMTSQLKHSFNCKARNDRMDRELASDNITFLVSSNGNHLKQESLIKLIYIKRLSRGNLWVITAWFDEVSGAGFNSQLGFLAKSVLLLKNPSWIWSFSAFQFNISILCCGFRNNQRLWIRKRNLWSSGCGSWRRM